MKTKLPHLLVTLCAAFATSSVFGQITYTWTGAADGTNLVNAGNWTPTGGPPNGNDNGVGDIAQWDGVLSSNLVISYGSVSLPNTGFGTYGIGLQLTANQTHSVQIVSPVAISAAVGVNNVTDSSAGSPIILGDSSANLLKVVGRPAGADHVYMNNSTATCEIRGSVELQAGGGTAYEFEFGGTGNWLVNNYLRNDNGSGPTTIQLDGPGNLVWGNTNAYAGFNSPLGPVNINGGTIILRNSGLMPFINPATVPAGNNTINNAGTLEYDAVGQSDTQSRVISGTGVLQVNNGTLLLAGLNTYTGNTVLTGGELVVDVAENIGNTNGPVGEGGEIVFSGGTLGFSVNNVYDYSGRFSTASGQAYSFDTAGQNVTFTNTVGLSSPNGTVTKLGNGTLTLAATSTYGGATTVSAGKLVFQGSKSGSGSITVNDGATLGVVANGSQIAPGTLTVGTSSGATLEFNNLSSTAVAPLAAGTIASAGTVTINVNSGTFTPGQSYPLMTWTGGSAPSFVLGILNGYIGNITVNGNTLTLNVTATAFLWTGANNGSWDLSTANNWMQNGASAVFTNNAPALIDDTATTTAITVNSPLTPTALTVNNSVKAISIASSGANNIGGSSTLTKAGTATLTLSGGVNSYTGVTTFSGGTVSVGSLANGGTASDIGSAGNAAANLVFNGGTLQYTGGGASIDRLFTLNTSGGTIDGSGGALTLNNGIGIAYGGNGPRSLTLTGTAVGNTLAPVIADNGGPTSLTISGTGKWILTGNNTYSGVTAINGGVLQVGAGAGTGATGTGGIVNNGGLDFNRTNNVTVGTVSGSGSVTNDGTGTVIMPGNNSYAGVTTINAGTVQIGNGGSTGSIDQNAAIFDNGTLFFNYNSGAAPIKLNGIISGTGQLIKSGNGQLQLLAAETFSGGITVNAGGLLQICSGNQGSIDAGFTITNNGTLVFVRQDTGVFFVTNDIIGTGSVVRDCNNFNVGDTTFLGTNTYTGGTFISGGTLILGDDATPGSGSIVGNVIFTNSIVTDTPRTLEFNRPDDFTFSGNILGNVVLGQGGAVAANAGALLQDGSDTLTLTGNNTYPAGTTINAGTLQLGNGGTTGSAGSGPVVDNTTLVFNRSDNGLVVAAVSGSGSVVQFGPGETTLSQSNTYTGSTTVSNGTLVVSAVASDIDVNAGATLIPGGAIGTIGTLYIGGNLNMTSGTIIATVNRSAAQTSSLIVFTNTTTLTEGTNTITGSTLKLLNYGTTLQVGDKFTLFNQPASGLTVVSPGFTVNNNLAVDGSVTVASVVGTAPKITTSVSGGELTLTWPAGYTGLHLQMQSGAITNGLTRNWVTIPGSDAGNSYQTPATKTPGVTFYRLVP